MQCGFYFRKKAQLIYQVFLTPDCFHVKFELLTSVLWFISILIMNYSPSFTFQSIRVSTLAKSLLQRESIF